MKSIVSFVIASLVIAFSSFAAFAQEAPAQVSDEASQAMIQYLHDQYGLEMLADNAAGQITCQSGGTCNILISGTWVWCTCGGGTVCNGGERCRCKCSQGTGGAVECAYGCETQPTPKPTVAPRRDAGNVVPE
jgi:hypothetical protein